MATSAFYKIKGFVENKNHGVHNLGSDQLALALSNTAPASESTDPTVLTASAVLANVTEVAYTNCSARNVTTTSSAQTAGVYKLSLTDLTLTASGGTVGAFRYVYLFNDATTSPADALIGYFDYGSSITLGDGESLAVDFSEANGVLTDE